jgi:hypothetical protein
MPPRSEWRQAWDVALEAGRGLEALRATTSAATSAATSPLMASLIASGFRHLHIVVHLTKPTRRLLS